MFFGIIAMILVGLSWIIDGVVVGRAPKLNLSISSIMLVGSFGCFAGNLIAVILTGGFNAPPSALAIVTLICVIMGIANYLQLDFMSRAMQNGPNGVIWSVVQSAFLFQVLMSIIFFGETKTALNYVGLASILTSLVLFGFLKENRSTGPWRLMMLLSFLSTIVSQCSSVIPSHYPNLSKVSSPFKVAIFFLTMALCGLIAKAVKKRAFMKEIIEDTKMPGFWTNCASMYIPFGTVEAILYFPGINSLKQANATVLAMPLMMCSCIIGFQAVAILFLHEKCSGLQWVALSLCLVGIVLFCI